MNLLRGLRLNSCKIFIKFAPQFFALMELKDIMSITGLPGLYKVIANRNDGVIVMGFHDNARRFVPSRQHMFTPLENITIYTTSEDPAELKQVFTDMKTQEVSLPKPGAKDDDAALRNYMKSILPDYDEEKVYVSDIRKLLKWYEMLDKAGVITLEETVEEAPTEELVETAEVIEETVNEAATTSETAAETETETKAAKPKKAKATKEVTEGEESAAPAPKKRAAKKSE